MTGLGLGLTVIDWLGGISKMIREGLGEEERRWAEWSAENPIPAALRLEAIARRLIWRASQRRRLNGRIANRLRSRAQLLREQADDLRKHARSESCERDPMRHPLGDKR